MDKKEIIEIIKNRKRDLTSRYGVRRLGLFGSYVKNRKNKRSDIDLLVHSIVILTCLILSICVNILKISLI